MSTKKQNKVDSVRQQWTQQRQGDTSVRGETPALRGSHFAKPAGTIGSFGLGETEGEKALFSVPSSAAPSPMVSPGTSAMPPAVTPGATSVATSSRGAGEGAGTASARRHLTIVGASGELPAVPRRATKNPAALPYSRYNKRYLTEPTNTPFSVVASAEKEKLSGAPAYAWKPYMVYGLVCVVASLVWGLVTRFALSGGGVPTDGDMSQTCGLVLLCLIVVSGVAVAVATSVVTLRNNEDVSGGDVIASSLGKTVSMMLTGIVVWFLMMILIMFPGF